MDQDKLSMHWKAAESAGPEGNLHCLRAVGFQTRSCRFRIEGVEILATNMRMACLEDPSPNHHGTSNLNPKRRYGTSTARRWVLQL